MIYQTRHLEALTEIPLGHAYHAKGDRFHATEIDANYLVRARKAKDVEDVTHIPVAAPSAQPPATARTDVNAEAAAGAHSAGDEAGAVNPTEAPGAPQDEENAASTAAAAPAPEQAASENSAALSTADAPAAATEQAPARHNARARSTRTSAAGK